MDQPRAPGSEPADRWGPPVGWDAPQVPPGLGRSLAQAEARLDAMLAEAVEQLVELGLEVSARVPLPNWPDDGPAAYTLVFESRRGTGVLVRDAHGEHLAALVTLDRSVKLRVANHLSDLVGALHSAARREIQSVRGAILRARWAATALEEGSPELSRRRP